MQPMAYQQGSSVLKQWLLVLLLFSYLLLFFPVPESPFVLGATLAIILWMVEKAIQ